MRATSLATLALASALAAQNQELGFDDGWGTTFTDRVGATTIEADLLNHFNDRDMRDWMLDPADPTGATYTCAGCRLVTQDQIGTTPASFTIVGYVEDTVTPAPNTPGALWFRTGIVNLPASTATGPVAWIWTINFAPPATPKGDVFMGASVIAETWPTDGVSLHCAFNGATGDNPGTGITSLNNANLCCFMPTAAQVPTPPAVFPAGGATGLRQIRFEVIAAISAGVAVTQTNQTSYPVSNPGAANSTPLGGTTNWLSGLHPDVYDGNLSATPRADDIGFLFKDPSMANQPVFIVLAFGPSPLGSLPVSSLSPIVAHPTTRGNVCVDFVNGTTFLSFANATGVVQQMIPLNAATRTIVQSFAPFDLWWQGLGLNPGAGAAPFEVHASGCMIQHL
ncbi:MAG: hypothetical protein IPK26_12635 [Planctomycetes bacterium]|nr:hypothetical protein [Planctomycetota bacterium]